MRSPDTVRVRDTPKVDFRMFYILSVVSLFIVVCVVVMRRSVPQPALADERSPVPQPVLADERNLPRLETGGVESSVDKTVAPPPECPASPEGPASPKCQASPECPASPQGSHSPARSESFDWSDEVQKSRRAYLDTGMPWWERRKKGMPGWWDE